MHPRIAELTDVLDRERAGLLAAVAALPADALDRRPAPDRWSPAQLLEHLRLVEDGSARLLARRLARAKEEGLPEETETSSVLDSLPAEAIVNGSGRTAPEMVTPAADVTAEAALEGLMASRQALRAVLEEGDGLALDQVRATHAVFGDLGLYQWALFIALHEARHARQLREMTTVLGSTS